MEPILTRDRGLRGGSLVLCCDDCRQAYGYDHEHGLLLRLDSEISEFVAGMRYAVG